MIYLEQVIDAEKQLHEDSGFLKQQLEALLQVNQRRAQWAFLMLRLEQSNSTACRWPHTV